MIHLNVQVDIRQAERFYSNLRKNAVKQAAARAINDTLITLRAEGARMIRRDHKALSIGAIKSAITMKRAHQHSLRGSVSTTGKPQTLLLFRVLGGEGSRRRLGPRGQVSLIRTRRPLTAVIGNQRSVIEYKGRKAFRVLAYGNEVFVRRHAKGRQIRRLRGPSLPGVFRAKGGPMKALAERRWATTFRSRMAYEIERAKR